MSRIDLRAYADRIRHTDAMLAYGKIADIVGLTIRATGPRMNIGDLCYVQPSQQAERIPVEVVGFRDDRILLMPLGNMHGIGPGSLVIPTHKPRMLRIGPDILGRVVGSLGLPIDDGPPIRWQEERPLLAAPPAPLSRERITEPIATGIKSIDAFATCGKGQRVAILAGSGVGKSKLIGMVARNTNADINVIALIGERGREVRDFIEMDLGEEGMKRSVVVVVTSDEPALLRLSGAYAATAIAEYYRDQGADVMLFMDSITRFAMAQREVGLAVGEPPTTKGYPPSVYSLLPKLLERAGNAATGSITGFYSVLVEADDLHDPIGDAIRSIIDGHVSLSRNLANRGQYPAIDILDSISRVMIDVTSEEHQRLATEIRQTAATYRDAEDLINIGAYVPGSNPEIDQAQRRMPAIREFCSQGLYEQAPYDEITTRMAAVTRIT